MVDDPSLPRVVVASVRRSFLEETSSLATIVLTGPSLAVALLSQAFLGRLVDSTPNAALGTYQGHFAAYVLLGVALLDLQYAMISGLGAVIRQAQIDGSLESLLATPTPPGRVLFALAVPRMLLSLTRLAIYLIAGRLIFSLSFASTNVPGVLCMIVATLLSFAPFALFGAALTMLFRRADPTSRLVAALSAVAGGVFYPRTVLPHWLAIVGHALPIGPALDGLRAAILEHAGPARLADPLARLLLIAAIFTPMSGWFFGRMINQARVDGSLTAW